MKTIAFSIDELVGIFNRLFPVGAKIRWRSVDSPNVSFREYTVARVARNQNGQAVCWVKERSGMISIAPGFVDYAEEKSEAAGVGK